MLRARIPLNLAKNLVNDSRADMNTQAIVNKTKSVIHNAAEATKGMAAAAKEKLYHPAAASNPEKMGVKPASAESVKKGDHRLTSKEVAGGECNVGFGPQVGVGDKMHDRADGSGRVDDPFRSGR